MQPLNQSLDHIVLTRRFERWPEVEPPHAYPALFVVLERARRRPLHHRVEQLAALFLLHLLESPICHGLFNATEKDVFRLELQLRCVTDMGSSEIVLLMVR